MSQPLKGRLQQFFQRFPTVRRFIPPRSAGHLYECYVYTLICRGAASQKLTLRPTNLIRRRFRFRASPGTLSSQYSWFEVDKGNKTFEVQSGIEYVGHTPMYHEMDVSVLPQQTAHQNTRPAYSDLLISTECKLYDSNSGLKGEVRKHVGTVIDLSHTAHHLQSGKGTVPAGCIHCGLSFAPAFVTNQVARADLLGFLQAYGLNPVFETLPRAPGERALLRWSGGEWGNL